MLQFHLPTYKYAAKDANGEIWLYVNMPIRGKSFWVSPNSGELKIYHPELEKELESFSWENSLVELI